LGGFIFNFAPGVIKLPCVLSWLFPLEVYI
jgi:hypothetical protein